MLVGGGLSAGRLVERVAAGAVACPRVCLWVGSESGVRITHSAKVCEHLLGTEGCAPRSGEHG